MLDISNLTDDDLLSAYLSRGELEEITVIAHKGSNDSRQLMNDSRVDGEKLKTGTQVNVVFRRPKGFLGAIKNVARIARGKREVHELVEVHGLDNPEEVSVKIDFGGKSRSFKLIHPSEAGIMRDITNEVSYDTKTGQPRFDSIDGIAGKWASELTRQLQESIAQG
jgi:hypothetical protein